MADEPRRSGRATKGQHTKDRDINEDGAPKKKGKGKPSKSKPVEEEEEENEIIRCICGTYEEEEEVPRAMICCDECEAWQHNDCMGLPEDYEPKVYYCEQCRPGEHKDLLAAIARGEKPWEEAAKRRHAAEAEKASKKKGKKGRKSASATVTASQEPEETPVPTATNAGQKRKAEETPVPEVKNKKVRSTPVAEKENGTTPAAPQPPRKASTPVSTPVRQPSRSESMSVPVANDPKELDNSIRKSAATQFTKSFIDGVKMAQKSGLKPKNTNAQELGIRLGMELERALYVVHNVGAGDPTDAYKNQMRSLGFNMKKNPDLVSRVIAGDLNPRELASMDPKDMASEEQQRKDAAIKQEMEKQHTIIQEQGPRIRRTHKGEEYIDESHQVASESNTSNTPVIKQGNTEMDGEVKSPKEEKTTKPRKPLSVNTQGKGKPDNRRKSSSNFDIDKVWSGVQGSPDAQTPRFAEMPQRGSPPPTGSGGDPEIDNLLKDEDAESEPYSPKDFNEDGVVWRGVVNGGSLGRFHIHAKFAAGATPEADTLRLTWSQVIPAEIVIHGRIQPNKADDYLCGLEYSSTSDLIVVQMHEPRDAHNLEQFEKFFRYLKNKERYGVGVQHENPAIKDIYLLPMDAGQTLPTFMKALETSFPDPVQERMLLVPIVIKNSELPHNINAANQANVMSPSVGPPVAQTPITPQETPQPFNAYGQPPNPNGNTPHASLQSPSPHGGANQLSSAPPPHYPGYPPVQSQSQSQAPPQYPPPAQQPNIPANASPAVSAAIRILGPQLAQAQAVANLCTQAPGAGDNEMRIVNECIQENPDAANDLGILTKMLQARSGQAQQARETQKSPEAGHSHVSPQPSAS